MGAAGVAEGGGEENRIGIMKPELATISVWTSLVLAQTRG